MSLSFAANFGSVDSLKVRTRCGASRCASRMRCTERRLPPAALASIRPVQWVASPGGGPSVRSTTRCTTVAGSGLLAGLARLVAGEPVDTLGHESRLPSPDHGLRFAGAAHDLNGTAALGRRHYDVGAPYMLLRRAAVRDDRLESTAIRPGDSHDNACSHKESLNCFGRFGNRPNESDH